MNRRRRSGFTLVELLVASAFIGIVGSALFSMLQFIGKKEAEVRNMSSQDRQVASLVENIRANLNLYQVSFIDGAEEDANLLAEILKVEELPMAWSLNTIVDKNQCPQCPGRLGYAIRPVSGMNGLFKVTLRITNKELFEGYRDYEFVATFK